MTRQLIVGPATVFSNAKRECVIPNAGVVCEEDRICAVGDFDELRKAYPEATHVDARGKLILPGLINAHHHLYSTFSRGMPVPAGIPMRNFCEILEGLWWRLDRALDLDGVQAGAYPPCLDCLRWGTTTFVDHHASPNAISGSLDCLQTVCDELGLRASLCYEITDRNGPEGTRLGIEENARYARDNTPSSSHGRRSPLLGFHASFTVSDETLKSAAELVPNVPIHIHVAEDLADVQLTQERHGCSILQRLHKFGLLRPNSVIVHGVHLEDDDLKLLASAGGWLVHNPESNANNAVGHLDVQRALDLGVRVCLGTDGMASNMLRAAKSAYLMLRAARRDPTVGFHVPRTLLFANNVAMARALFGEPLLGSLQPGAPADLCVVDYDPPTPLDSSTFDGHFVFGVTEAAVFATVTAGKLRMLDGKALDIPIDAVYADIAASAKHTWDTLSKL